MYDGYLYFYTPPGEDLYCYPCIGYMDQPAGLLHI